MNSRVVSMVVFCSAMAIFTNAALAAEGCLISVGGMVNCTEYTSANPQLLELFKQQCSSSANSQWLPACPGHFGCELVAGPITSTAWFQTETEAQARQACQTVNGTFKTK